VKSTVKIKSSDKIIDHKTIVVTVFKVMYSSTPWLQCLKMEPEEMERQIPQEHV
jgi:hypothetical protein